MTPCTTRPSCSRQTGPPASGHAGQKRRHLLSRGPATRTCRRSPCPPRGLPGTSRPPTATPVPVRLASDREGSGRGSFSFSPLTPCPPVWTRPNLRRGPPSPVSNNPRSAVLGRCSPVLPAGHSLPAAPAAALPTATSSCRGTRLGHGVRPHGLFCFGEKGLWQGRRRVSDPDSDFAGTPSPTPWAPSRAGGWRRWLSHPRSPRHPVELHQ